MQNSRESIYSALFALVSTSSAFKTAGRKFKPWTEVPPESQPSIFQVQTKETPHNATGQPPAWKLEVELVMYVNSNSDISTPTSMTLNPIIDAIEALFDPTKLPANTKQTLGGLVHYARIGGTIETDEGVLGNQAYCIIPIEIMTY